MRLPVAIQKTNKHHNTHSMKLRGKQLFESLNDGAEIDLVVEKKKGRSRKLIQQRNELLFYRYYYYAKLKKYKYELVVRQLQQEFCLSPHTITEIIVDNATAISAIYSEHLESRELSKRFPHLNWNI